MTVTYLHMYICINIHVALQVLHLVSASYPIAGMPVVMSVTIQ